jgi:hypothetical protein
MGIRNDQPASPLRNVAFTRRDRVRSLTCSPALPCLGCFFMATSGNENPPGDVRRVIGDANSVRTETRPP